MNLNVSRMLQKRFRIKNKIVSDVSSEAKLSQIKTFPDRKFFNGGYFNIQNQVTNSFIAAHFSGDIHFLFHRTDFFNLKNLLYILDLEVKFTVSTRRQRGG